MKVLLPLFFLLLQANTYAQKNDTLRVYFDSSLRRVPQHMAQIAGQAFKHGDVWFANLFYPNGQILCEIGFENKKLTIRHGPYTLYNTSGVPIEKGNYSNDMLDGAVSTWFSSAKPSAYVEYQMGVKTGVSKQWYENGNPEHTGAYQLGLPAGEWVWYFPNGKPSTKETYNRGKLVALECFDSSGKSLGPMCNVRKEAFLLGDIPDFKNYVVEYLQWPKEAFDKGINGLVKVSFEVSEHGKLRKFSITESTHEMFSVEVQKVFEGMPDWSPAISHNRAIPSVWEMSIPFYHR